MSREHVLRDIQQKFLKFEFDEKDLSPKLKQKIGESSSIFDEIQYATQIYFALEKGIKQIENKIASEVSKYEEEKIRIEIEMKKPPPLTGDEKNLGYKIIEGKKYKPVGAVFLTNFRLGYGVSFLITITIIYVLIVW